MRKLQGRFKPLLCLAATQAFIVILLFSTITWSSLIEADKEGRERKGIHWGAMPVFNYTSDIGLNLGFFVRRFNYGEGKTKPFESLWTAQYSSASRGPKGALLSFEKTAVSVHQFRLYFELLYAADEDQKYFGLGDDSSLNPSVDRSSYYEYSLHQASFQASIRKEIFKDHDLEFGLTPIYERSKANAFPSQYFNDFGSLEDQTYFTRFHLGWILDRRDSEFIPSKGFQSSLFFSTAPSFLANSKGWSRWTINHQKYFSLIDDRWLWFAGQFRYTATTSNAPLTQKAQIGSRETLRGLPLNRYLSNQSTSLRGELRSVWLRLRIFNLPAKLGTGVFTEVGKVGTQFGQLMKNKLHHSWGVSFFGSYFTDDFLGAMDWGFSEGEVAVYLRLGHAF